MTRSDDDDAVPMVNITDKGYYVAVWFLAGKECDWLCVLHRETKDGVLKLDYRFRYYAEGHSQDPFDGRDQKNFYAASIEGKTEDEAIQVLDGMVNVLVRGGFLGTRLPWKVRDRKHRLIIRGDKHAFIRAMARMPFVHASTTKKRQRQEGN